MVGGGHSEPALPADACGDFSERCEGRVEWRHDGIKRCDEHQRRHETARRKQTFLSLTVALLAVAVGVVVVNALIRPEQGPSQARAWEVCHGHAANNLDLPEGTHFAELPLSPSDRVKLSLGSDVYFVFSYYELADLTRRDFRCTVRYLGHDEWVVADLTVAP
jgi:hypothetical protein